MMFENTCTIERGTSRPPEKTAAPTGIGSGGKEDTKAGAPSEKQGYYTNRLTATSAQPPRIMALHFGLEAEEAGR